MVENVITQMEKGGGALKTYYMVSCSPEDDQETAGTNRHSRQLGRVEMRGFGRRRWRVVTADR